MHASLFLPGDSVLLIGEGNFSFAVGLVNLNLSINITATCFEPEVTHSNGRENLLYLENKGARVLLGVDGTKLTEHSILRTKRFSKIVFNFPHVGGKMKINLNRQLLKEFCVSASQLLEEDGKVVITLCKGQGGTGAEKAARRWDDTWQVVEMAAHGDLVLVGVELFHAEVFPNYTCVGYRSRDKGFHMDDALVHVFTKVEPPSTLMDVDLLMREIDQDIIESCHGQIKCSKVYADKYKNSIFKRTDSPCNFLFKTLCDLSSQMDVVIKYFSDENLPLHINNLAGEFFCSVGDSETRCVLRSSLLDILPDIITLWESYQAHMIVCSGLVFHRVTGDFHSSPVSSETLLLGRDVSRFCEQYLKHVIQLCNRLDLNMEVQRNASEHSSETMVYVKDNVVVYQSEGELEPRNLVAQVFVARTSLEDLEMCVIFVDRLAAVLFSLDNWRELWPADTHVELRDQTATLKVASLFPSTFTFDMNIVYRPTSLFNEYKFYHLMWDMAGDVIQSVEARNNFISPNEWSATCYRIQYWSPDKALYRSRVIKIHDTIGKVLCAKLGIEIS